MTGLNENLQGNGGGEVLIYNPTHPYAVPGQVCDDVQKRSGPCSGEPFAKYAQCSLPTMWSRVALKGTVSGAAAAIVFSAANINRLAAFTTGLGGTLTQAGYPSTIQGNKMSEADTSVAKNSTGAASLAPDDNMTYKVIGTSMGFQEVFTVVGGRKQYNTPWLKAYWNVIQRVLLTELNVTAKFGSTTVDQLFGPPVIWRKSNFQDGNPEAGSPVYTRCQWMTGAPNDSDRLEAQVSLPYDIEVASDPDSPTPGETEIYAQLNMYLYGSLECRDKAGICPTPEAKEVDKMRRELAEIKALLQRR